jgi:thiol-disulfide isomerase/thioredoxin
MRARASARYVAAIGIFVIAAISVGAWLFLRDKDGGEHAERVYPIKDLSFETLESAPAALGDVQAPLRVVTTWATWCSLCLGHLQALIELRQEMAEHVAVIAINRSEPKPTQELYLKSHELIESGIVFFLDPADSLYAAVQGYDMPETLFMTEDDTVVAHIRSVMTLEELRTTAHAALEAQ